MTECERIVRDKILPKEFFEEEIRCDFKISKFNKKIWAISIDLLMTLDKVCRDNGLKYYVMFGSLLGAVRHHGFIPWDDDMDISMFRKDYDALIELAKQGVFKYPYFLQTQESDKGYHYSFIKLRNSNTTGMKAYFRDADFNNGLCIDIFPIDNCILDGIEERYKKIRELNIDNSNYMRLSLKDPSKDELARINMHSGRNPQDVSDEIQKISTMYNGIETENVGFMAVTIYECRRSVFKRNDFRSTIYMDFEGVINVPVPIGYKNILTSIYGDYMKFPPLNERGNWHKSSIFDPDTPYKDFKYKLLEDYK